MSFDDQRATAVIKRAQEHLMYPGDVMPASEGERIMVAEELVQTARQVEQVKDAWEKMHGSEVALQNTPTWPAAEAILMEAQVFVGANESTNGASSATELPSAPSSNEEERQTGGLAESAPPPPAAPSQEIPSVSSRTDGEASATAEPQESTPPSAVVSTSQGDLQADEIWADAQGQEWEVVSYGGGLTVDVKLVATGERTFVPAGTLKTRVRAVEDQQPEDPALDVPAAESGWSGAPEEPSPQDVALQEDYEQDQRGRPLTTNELTVDQSVETIARREADSAVSQLNTSALEHDDDDDEQYGKILAETEDRYTRAGMPIPHDLEDPPDFIPMEALDDVPDKEARRLHAQYNALAARAKYLHDIERARERECKALLKLHMRGAMRVARKALGKSATVEEVKGWAEDNDELVQTWTERARKHMEEANAFKTFLDINTENVSVLSRDWTMRDKQMQS